MLASILTGAVRAMRMRECACARKGFAVNNKIDCEVLEVRSIQEPAGGGGVWVIKVSGMKHQSSYLPDSINKAPR